MRSCTLLALLAVAAAAPSGTYTGSKSILGVTVNGSIKIDDDTHFDLGITGAATINCASEEYALSGSDISLPNAQTSGDCVHDQLASNKVSLESLSYDSGADSITVNVKKSIVKISITLKKGGFDNDAIDATDACSETTQSACDAASGCTWCKCAALPSKCWTKEDAAKLPAGVYVCDSTSSQPTFLRGAKVETA